MREKTSGGRALLVRSSNTPSYASCVVTATRPFDERADAVSTWSRGASTNARSIAAFDVSAVTEYGPTTPLLLLLAGPAAMRGG